MVMVWTYAVYLAISVGLTVWVGWTLYRNGRLFLIDALKGNDKLADSINHLLLVGFYLVNIGFVSVALRYGGQAQDVQAAVEYLSTKVGIVLLVLGAMHFANLFVLSRMRRRALRPEPADVLRAEPVGHRHTLGMRTVAVPLDDDQRR